MSSKFFKTRSKITKQTFEPVKTYPKIDPELNKKLSRIHIISIMGGSISYEDYNIWKKYKDQYLYNLNN